MRDMTLSLAQSGNTYAASVRRSVRLNLLAPIDRRMDAVSSWAAYAIARPLLCSYPRSFRNPGWIFRRSQVALVSNHGLPIVRAKSLNAHCGRRLLYVVFFVRRTFIG